MAASRTRARSDTSSDALPVASGGPLTHGQFEATADNRVNQAARGGQNLNAAAYLHINFAAVRSAIREYLTGRPMPLADSQVRFRDEVGYGGFIAALLAPLAGDDDSTHVRRLRSWLAPTSLDALVDSNRPLFEAARTEDVAEYVRGAKGPSGWYPAVGVAIGSALELGLADSLPRMCERLIATTAARRASTHLASEQVRVPGELVPATPLDWQVARAMVGAGPTVEVRAGALHFRSEAQVRYRKLTRVEWQGDKGGPWNAVRVEPADAGPEEVAAELLHSPTEAYRLRHVGPFYLLPEQAALAFPGARTAQAAERLTRTPGTPSGEEQLALSSIGRSLADDETRLGFGATAGPAAEPAALLHSWTQIAEQLRWLAITVEGVGIEHALDAALSFHAGRRAELAHMHGRDAATRAAAMDLQRALLTQVGAELGPLVLVEATKLDEPRRRAIARLIRVANLSHLPTTGRAALEEAHTAQEESLYDTLEAILGQAATFVEIARRSPASRARASQAVFGAGLSERVVALRGELAVQRMRARRGTVTSTQLEELHIQVEALRTDARLIAEIGALATTFDLLDRLEGSGWVLFAEALTSWSSDDATDNHIGRLETVRRGAAELRGVLETAHSRWLKAQGRAFALAQDLAAAGAKDPGGRARAAIDADVAAILLPLRACGGHAAVQAFLGYANETATSAERRALIAQIAVTVGAAVVAEGVGSFAEGLIAGGRVVSVIPETATAEAAALAARAAGSRALASQVVGAGVNAVSFTALQASLTSTPLVQGFASNFIGNLAGFAGLRATRRALDGLTAGRAGAALWAARTANLTAPLIVSTAVQFVQTEYETALRHGRLMTWDELQAAGTQTLAMMIGSAIAHHVLRSPLQQARDAGFELAAARAQRKQLATLADQVSKGGDPLKALELLWATRTYLDKLGHQGPSGERAQRALSSLAPLERGAVAAQLGLDVVIVGRIYAGEHDAVTRVAEAYQRAGNRVDPTWDGYIVGIPESPWSSSLTLIDRSASRRPAQERPASTRPMARHVEDRAAGEPAPAPTPRVDAPAPGLYEAIDPKAKIADWDMFDVLDTNAHGVTRMKTKVALPDGSVGLLLQRYDPKYRQLQIDSVFLDQLPKWIAEGPALVEGKGTPTVTYLLHRQWKVLGVERGSLKKLYLKNVEELRSVIELAALVADGMPPEVAVLRTHTMEYVTTLAVQSGHRIAGAKLKPTFTLPLDDVMRRFETPTRTLATSAERKQRDPAIAARNDQLLQTYGKGRITRKTPVMVDFDIELDLTPFHGRETNGN